MYKTASQYLGLDDHPPKIQQFTPLPKQKENLLLKYLHLKKLKLIFLLKQK